MNDSKIINKLENLKKLRESKKITQIKLSVDLGVSQELISRYEVGSSFPQPQMLIKIADYFNCSVDYLLGRTTNSCPIEDIICSCENSEAIELYSKYKLLSSYDKKYLNHFLDFLLNNKE